MLWITTVEGLRKICLCFTCYLFCYVPLLHMWIQGYPFIIIYKRTYFGQMYFPWSFITNIYPFWDSHKCLPAYNASHSLNDKVHKRERKCTCLSVVIIWKRSNNVQDCESLNWMMNSGKCENRKNIKNWSRKKKSLLARKENCSVTSRDHSSCQN